jgi:hypothetical protein
MHPRFIDAAVNPVYRDNVRLIPETTPNNLVVEEEGAEEQTFREIKNKEANSMLLSLTFSFFICCMS